MSRSYNNQEQLAANTHDVLQRTGASLQRSNQIAYETEQIGTEVSYRQLINNIFLPWYRNSYCRVFCSSHSLK